MAVPRIDGGTQAIPLNLDEVDERGNLRGFIADGDELGSLSADEAEKEPPQPLKRLKRKRSINKGVETRAQLEEAIRKKRRAEVAAEESQDSSYDPDEFSKLFNGKIVCELYNAFDVIHPHEIIGRDLETRRILSMIMQPRGGVRPLLVGPAGIGKFSIVKKVAKVMKTNVEMLPLGNRKIFCLDCSELLANSLGENVTEVLGRNLQEIVRRTYKGLNSNSIFYFRHIEKILHLEHVTELVQSILRRPLPFIASISEDAKSEIVIKARSILEKYNFSAFPVEEAPFEDVQSIVRLHLQNNPLHPAVELADDAVNLCVRLAAKYEHTQPFPIKGINLIQECVNGIIFRRQFPRPREFEKIVITPKEIAEIVSVKTKVPAVDLLDDSIFNQNRFMERLRSRVVGQEYALKMVSDCVAIYKMKLADSKKPWGVFLFVGPTGVGKTELAKGLAGFLFEDESKLITINGSEYIEEYTVSNLIGSPKGYEGNDSGGLLTEPLKKNPHQVVLLDEFEKAHKNVQRLFLQIFDSGIIIDRKGDRVDCSPTLFIMTSNVGSSMLCEMAAKGGISHEQVIQRLIPELKKEFSPELVGRFRRGIVPFQPLNRGLMPDVAAVKLTSIRERLKHDAEIDFTWTPELVQHFVTSDVDISFGMREFCNMINETVASIIKDAFIQSKQRITGKLELTYLKDKKEFGLTVSKK